MLQGGEGRENTPTHDLQASASTSSTSQHRHSNHDRREAHHGESSRHYDPQKPSSHEHREHHRDPHVDKRKDGAHLERKPHSSAQGSSHHPESRGPSRGDHHSTHPHRKDAQHEQRERSHHDSAHRKDTAQVKKEHEFNGGRSLTPQPNKPHIDPARKTDHSKEVPVVKSESTPNAVSSESGQQSSTPNEPPRKTKSETAINFKEYMKRKEKERKEKEMADKLRAQLEMDKTKQRASESSSNPQNRTFTEGSSNSKEQKHRPPKLDVSLPLPGRLEEKASREDKERPYQVNIKSPIKPHTNITVKSPIKSSDLKQPKLEISKVQITPEKEGKDPFSVNINNDAMIRKLIDTSKEGDTSQNGNSKTHIKQEPGISPRTNRKSPKRSPRVKLEVPSPNVKKEMDSGAGAIKDMKFKQEVKSEFKQELKLEIKQESEMKLESNIGLNVKKERDDPFKGYENPAVSKLLTGVQDELEPGEIEDSEPEITLLPEHTAAPTIKLHELEGLDDKGLDSAVALKNLMRKEASGGGTPSSTHGKSGTESGPNTPIRMKLPIQNAGESPSLKIKISTKGLSTDSASSSSKHGSPHRHKHKHKEKHKHKHSKDKHRDKHREKHTSSSSGTNGQSLKLNIKLSDIPASSSSEVVSKHRPDKPKHRTSISDPSLIKNAVGGHERQQPWSMNALASKSTTALGEDPSSRKRRRDSNIDQNIDASQSKSAKTGPNRIRRSSSNHSVVSMEMSDEENNSQPQANGQAESTQSVMNKLQEAIRQQQNKIAMYQKQLVQVPPSTDQLQGSKGSPQITIKPIKKPIDRQQSGFDLDGMMWADPHPPLPMETPPPPPPPV